MFRLCKTEISYRLLWRHSKISRTHTHTHRQYYDFKILRAFKMLSLRGLCLCVYVCVTAHKNNMDEVSQSSAKRRQMLSNQMETCNSRMLWHGQRKRGHAFVIMPTVLCSVSYRSRIYLCWEMWIQFNGVLKVRQMQAVVKKAKQKKHFF